MRNKWLGYESNEHPDLIIEMNLIETYRRLHHIVRKRHSEFQYKPWQDNNNRTCITIHNYKNSGIKISYSLIFIQMDNVADFMPQQLMDKQFG